MKTIYLHHVTIDSIKRGKVDIIVFEANFIATVGLYLTILPLNNRELLNPVSVDVKVINVQCVTCSETDLNAYQVAKIIVAR